MKKVNKRTVRPNATDKFILLYNNAVNGGVSQCITGHSPADKVANVLPNCVGYACGRFNEIYDDVTGTDKIKFCKYCGHANTFTDIAKAYGHKVGTVAMVGAIMCWAGGTSGHGHVCVVEVVIDPNTVCVSESSWTERTVFKYRKRTRLLGSWSTNPTYRFKGFIYNPALYDNPYPVPERTIKKGCKGNDVKWVQYQLNKSPYIIDKLTVDGSAGAKTIKAIEQYQLNKGLQVDSKAGRQTLTYLINEEVI